MSIHRVLSTLTALSLGLALSRDARLPGRFLLKVQPVAERVEVTLNGKTFAYKGDPRSYTAERSVDVTGLMRPGKNTLTVDQFRGAQRSFSAVTLAHSRDGDRYRQLFHYHFTAEDRQEDSFDVYPDTGGPSVRASSGSYDGQTVFRITSARTTLTVWVNGRPLGEYPSFITRDISSYVRPGRNEVRLRWRGRLATFRISHAEERDVFKEVFEFDNNVNRRFGGAGEQTFTFTLPE